MPLTIDGQANSIASSVGGVNIPATVGTLSVGPSGSYMNVTSSGIAATSITSTNITTTQVLNSSGRPILNQSGSILQVNQAYDTARRDVSATGGVPYDWTALSVTTNRVSTSSKLLIQFSGTVTSNAIDWDGVLYSSLDGIIVRGDVSSSRARCHWSSGTDNGQYSSYAMPCFSATILYTPSNSTSSITINPRVTIESSGTLSFQKDRWDGNDTQAHTGVSSLIVMEVSA